MYSKAAWNKSGNAEITCPADPAADGIRVLYRAKDGKLQNSCKSVTGSFTCSIPSLDPQGAYQFYVMKYKTVKGSTGYSTGVVISRNYPETKLEAPEKIQVCTENGKTSVYSINSPEDNGISVLRLNGDNFDLFCEGTGNSCSGAVTGADAQGFYYIMRYATSDGTNSYTEGVFANNKYSSAQ